jgi:hypothetical protein
MAIDIDQYIAIIHGYFCEYVIALQPLISLASRQVYAGFKRGKMSLRA